MPLASGKVMSQVVVEPLTNNPKIKGLIPVDAGILEEKMADFSIWASVFVTAKW